VAPTHHGPAFVQGRSEGDENLASADRGVKVTASSFESVFTRPEYVLDDNYATRWAPTPGDQVVWLQLDLRSVQHVERSEIRFEYAWKSYPFTVEASSDGLAWKTVADFRNHPVTGSPVIIQHATEARYLRLIFPAFVQGRNISIFEWQVF
jgi:hypothetical protein